MPQTLPLPPPGLNLAELGAALHAAAARARHRRLVVLAGERHWTRDSARALLAGTALEEILWIGDQAPEGARALPPGKALRLLGTELDDAVYDSRAGFDPDAFGAVAGAIRGGGLLLLATPPLAEWPAFTDPEYRRITVAPHPPELLTGRFLDRAARILRESSDATLIEQQEKGFALHPARPDLSAPPPESAPQPYRTRDQQWAVEAVLRVVSGQRRRPVVLVSDRGRGKSSALGLAAAELLRGSRRRILVTGPGLEAVEPLFRHARRRLEGARGGRGALHFGTARLEFQPPDRILRERPETDLLLVDEAAAIPTPLLEGLLERYSRIAFATTVHGYEGTGRGFALRFSEILDRRTRGWRTLRLETPVRWAPGDPLERLAFRLLLLDAEPAPAREIRDARPETCIIEEVDRDRLASDETTLGELFGLLVLAHYRTRPYDLRHLLDGPNLSVHLMRHGEHVVGALLAAREGGFDGETSRAIWAGERRPQGHLLPETLAAHLGLSDVPRLHGIRILRIAIHPALQGRGLGTHLLREADRELEQERPDYLGTSFGATPRLLRFWRAGGYRPVRLSVKRGATSGAHSALLLRGVSPAGRELAAAAHRRFIETFPHQLTDPLRGLKPELALALLTTASAPLPPALDDQDRLDLEAFAHGHRIYETVVAPLWKLACAALTDPRFAAALTPLERELLLRKAIQKQGWPEAASPLPQGGRTAVTTILREGAKKLLQCLPSPSRRAGNGILPKVSNVNQAPAED